MVAIMPEMLRIEMTEQGMTSAVMRAMVIPSTVMLDPVVSTLVQPVMLQAGMRLMLWRTVVTAM